MLLWIKKHIGAIVSVLVCIGFLVYVFGCQPKTPSLRDRTILVNRQELQLELDQFITMAQLRMADLDKQEQLRAIVLQNALILVDGQPFNPLGIITALAAIYGIKQGGSNVTKVIKTGIEKRKVNNG